MTQSESFMRTSPLTTRRLNHLEQMSTEFIQSKGGWRKLTAEDKAHIVDLAAEKLCLIMCDGYRQGGDPQQYLLGNARLLKEELREAAIAGANKHYNDWLNDEFHNVFSAGVN